VRSPATAGREGSEVTR